MAFRQKRIITSLVLIIAFLFTALAIPLLNSTSVKSELSEFVIKAVGDLSGNSAQLPIAEKESKEEENYGKKGQNIFADLISSPFADTFISNYKQNFILQSTKDEVQKQIPLYLYKRYLLI